MPDLDRNGRKIPKGKAAPVKSLVKVCGWILDMVHASQTAVSLEFLSERTGVARNHLKERYLNNMTVAGLIKETEEGYMTTTNVEQALKDELEVSGCNERADLQRERHDREREAYHMRKNEKTDVAPTEEEMDAVREQNDEEFTEDFDGIEMKPVQGPPDLWPLYALIDKRVRTSRGYGKLWQVFSDRIGVVLEDEDDQVTFLEPGEVEPVLKAVA
jgi:DNA-binding IscR family transcriptional regulator